MAALRKHKAEMENSLELLSNRAESIDEEENLEFCESICLEIRQKRMLLLCRFMQAIQALNDLFAHYLRSHGYNSEAHIFSILNLQHDPYRIGLHHYRKTDLNPLIESSKLQDSQQLSVVRDNDDRDAWKDRTSQASQRKSQSDLEALDAALSTISKPTASLSRTTAGRPGGGSAGNPYADIRTQTAHKANGSEKNLFYRFVSQFLEPKLKDILHKAGRRYLGLDSIQLKQLHIFFSLGALDFYSRTEILVEQNPGGNIYKLNYNGMQANAIAGQCAELIGSHPDLTRTLNYQIISFPPPAQRRSEELGSLCGVIHEISPHPIPLISQDRHINGLLQEARDHIAKPYLVADVQLRLIDNKSVGAYIVHKLHARGRHDF